MSVPYLRIENLLGRGEFSQSWLRGAIHRIVPVVAESLGVRLTAIGPVVLGVSNNSDIRFVYYTDEAVGGGLYVSDEFGCDAYIPSMPDSLVVFKGDCRYEILPLRSSPETLVSVTLEKFEP